MPLEGVGRYESVAVSSTAVPITTTVMSDGFLPMAAMITVEGDDIRFRMDGTNPTASEGHLAEVGSVITLTARDQLTKFRAIRVTTDAVLKVTQGENYRP